MREDGTTHLSIQSHYSSFSSRALIEWPDHRNDVEPTDPSLPFPSFTQSNSKRKITAKQVKQGGSKPWIEVVDHTRRASMS